MLCAGDEYGRTQAGNNNAYCQDNSLSWLNWQRDALSTQFEDFTKKLIRFRREHPIFRRKNFFQGRKIRGAGIKDIMWFNPGGTEMNDFEWGSHFARCLGMLLSGDAPQSRDHRVKPVGDGTFLLLCNAHHEPMTFVLPGETGFSWELLLATDLGFLDKPETLMAGDEVELIDRSLSLFQRKMTDNCQPGKDFQLKTNPTCFQ